jgi:hypothetical protein
MAYIYEVSFEIPRDQVNELMIGASLERVLGFLRTLLPGETGFITSRTMYSVDGSNPIQVRVWSEWQNWEDLLVHKDSQLVEDKLLKEFQAQIKMEHLTINILSEVD